MTNQLPFDMVLPVEVIRRWATEYKEAGYAPEALLEYVAWEATHWGVMKASGNPVRVMHQHPQPVAVSERLPGPEDCDAKGRCWAWKLDDEDDAWHLELKEWINSPWTTHWLPANALPQPS